MCSENEILIFHSKSLQSFMNEIWNRRWPRFALISRKPTTSDIESFKEIACAIIRHLSWRVVCELRDASFYSPIPFCSMLVIWARGGWKWHQKNDGNDFFQRIQKLKIVLRSVTKQKREARFFRRKYSKLFHIIRAIDSDNDTSSMTRLNISSSL